MRHVRRGIGLASIVLLAPLVGCAKGNDNSGTGAAVRLLGVNRSGSEYMCSPPTQGGTTFDGSTGPSSINALLTWNINTVRLPLNEHCWLGINGALVSSDEYQSAIV